MTPIKPSTSKGKFKINIPMDKALDSSALQSSYDDFSINIESCPKPASHQKGKSRHLAKDIINLEEEKSV